MKMPSVMTHQFSQSPAANIPRSQFDRSHGRKTTFQAGKLIPIYVDEALPGDTFNLSAALFGRLVTPITPVMDNIYLDTFFFAVPIRLLWTNWKKFNGEQTNPGDSTDYLVPIMTSTAGTGYLTSSIHDYLGLPTGVPGLDHSALWHRAHNLIWNEWFRDQNLQNSVVNNTGNGPDSPSDYGIYYRGKRHDYFTSALPWPQKGTAVTIPAAGTATVKTTGVAPTFTGAGFTDRKLQQQASTNILYLFGSGISGNNDVAFGNTTGLTADLSTATMTTINALRQAFQIQKLYERDARGGTRYIEIIRSHFGVISPDARQQRPEYLGGGSTNINFHPIAQTSASGVSGGTTPQANLAALAVGSGLGHGFVKSFTEHCVLIGYICARADLTYQNTLQRMFSRRTRWDFYWPALSHLGEQTILNKEIWPQGTANPTADAAVFGYQERYAEYRYKLSEVNGLFKSEVTAGYSSLDFWHLCQDFDSLPALDSTFIQENPPIGRIIATSGSQDQFLVDMYFKLKCARPMPVYSVPGLVDHF